MSIVRKHLALFDLHIPHHINLSPVFNFIKDYCPTDLIIGGDYLNLEMASHWNEKEFKVIGYEKVSSMLRKEIDKGKQVLRELNSVLPKECNKYFIPGNHEDWLYWACLTYPMICGGINLGVEKMNFKSDLAKIRKKVLADLLSNLLDMKSLGYKVLPLDKELTLGKITYIHGHQINTMAALRKKYPACNVVCGHHHSEAVETLHNSGNNHKANQYVQVPCLCKLSPGYLRDGSTRWLQGFWVADHLANGTFAGHVIKVIEGKILYAGNVYK